MKIFRFIGIALFAVLMCVNLASCSSDDDPRDDVSKKIAKIVCTGEYDNELSGTIKETITLKFIYDSKGRLIEAINTNNQKHEWYSWEDYIDEINVEYSSSMSSSKDHKTLSLTNGLVRDELNEQGQSVETYIYNQSNRLVKTINDYWTISAVWDGDKLVSINGYYGEDDVKRYTYDKSCIKGYNPIIGYNDFMEYEFPLILIAHPELAGLRTTQLPASRTNYWKDEPGSSTTYAYEFDNEGYISKITKIKTSEHSGEQIYTYTLTWK